MKKAVLFSVFVLSFLFLSAQNNFLSKNESQYARNHNIIAKYLHKKQLKSSPKANPKEACNVQDSLALVALYNSTDGPTDWTNKTNWTTDSVYKWYGVTLDANGRVTQLDLNKNGLTGTIPAKIGNWAELLYLDLSNNQLSGTIPAEIGNWTKFLYLDLSENQLSGTIPAEIDNWTKLLYLNLSKNQLSGTIPAEIDNWTKLIVLDLGKNQLTGNIPTEIGNLDSLQYLYLYYNHISGNIPVQIGNLTKLQELCLNDNQFSGTIPAQIGNLTKLQFLFLEDNKFYGSIPAQLGNLTKLTDLFLQNNKLNSLPNLSSLDSLNYCSIQKNKFDFGDLQTAKISTIHTYIYYPQANIGDTTYYKFVAGNDYSFSDSMGGSGNQYHWFKNGTAISGETDSVLKLTNVSISDTGKYYCEITNPGFTKLTLKTEPFFLDTFVYAVNFSVVDNNSQPIKNAKISINNSNFLTDANGKKTIGLPSGDYTATIYRTGFIYKTTSFSIEKADKNINISLQAACNIQDSLALVALYDSTKGDWTNKTNWLTEPVYKWYGVSLNTKGRVTELNLSANKLTGIIPAIIGNLTKLQDLDLEDNQLSGNIPSSIGNLTKLKNLYLDHNQLSGNIPAEIGNLDSLKNLYLNGNQLSSNIPTEIGNLINLQYLNLEENQLTGNIPTQIGNLTSLQGLYLEDNQLSGNIPPQIGNLENLQYLHLGNNQFDSLPDLSKLNKLSECNIKNNKFDFGDLQTAEISASSFTYSPQANIGDTTYFKFIAGNDYSFSDSVGGSGNQYKWFKNGTAISGETDSVLKLTNVSISDTGKYYCQITNPTFSKLTLQTQPFILTPFYSIMFSVVDKNSSPIENALIYIKNINKNLSTDASGKSSIELYAGNYNVICSKTGFINNTIDFSVKNADKNINITLQAACNVQDSLALVALYDSTNGAGWTSKSGWLTDPVYQWSNITLNINGRITNLNLSSNKLSGNIPAQIGNLTSLQDLELSYNHISGNIPTEIGNLTSLQNLYLNNNYISGAIPSQIGNLTKLQDLDLGSNQFSGSIPATIGNLTSLKELSLPYNLISGAIPATIGNLAKLQKLYLQNNLISGAIPATIGNLTELQELNLGNNQFNALPDLSALNKLNYCKINNNKFDFGDLQTANISASFYSYSPQANIGDTTYFKFTEGNDYSFYDSVGGSGNQYKWFKNGTAISGKTDSILNISKASMSDTGKYYCEITNSKYPSLTLNTQPFFLDTSVYAVNFSVVDNNSSPIEYAKISINNFNFLTDANGKKSIGLPSGDYTAITSKTGFVNDTAAFSVKNADEDINITLQAVTAIAQNSANRIVIYPNPVSDNFFVKNAGNSVMTITDMFGRKVLRTRLNSDNQQIDISNLQSGLYILNINLKKSVFQTKIIVK